MEARAPLTSRTGFTAAVVFALAALIPAIALFGFTVDDALISARYATNIARGAGYRFNAGGPITDGVTPLGFPYLLAPFAQRGPLFALSAAKIMGVSSWVIAAAVLGAAVSRGGGKPRRFLVIAMVAASAPLGAWSAAGMETGLAIAFGALAVALPALGAPRAGACAAGLLAWLRPECLPFAIVLGAVAFEGKPRVSAIALTLVPFALAAAIRVAVFGRPVPLSALAKPSDAVLGFRYALACLILTGPIALVAPRALLLLDRRTLGTAAAIGLHFAAIGAAGGDWMPLSRLAAPALPALILVTSKLIDVARPWASALRLALALAGELFTLVRIGPSAARVGDDRRALIAELAPRLRSMKTLAALDIGWVGAATDATIVDFAGLTDPAIAALPGGHTSKRIPPSLLDGRGVTGLVLLVREGQPVREPWSHTFFARAVELHVAALPGVGEAFAPVAESHAPHLRYLVLAERADHR